MAETGREAFERAVKGEGISLKRRRDGEYAFDSTSNIYLGWTIFADAAIAKLREMMADCDYDPELVMGFQRSIAALEEMKQ